MTALDPRVQALLDKDEIRDCVSKFARAVDRHDWELARTCYHPGGIDDHGVFTGDKDDYVDWVSENLPQLAEVTMHFVGNVLIELDGDVARSEAYLVGYHRYTREDGTKADFIGGARYVDRVERRDGAWRIVHRVLVWEWVRDDPVGWTWEGFGIDPSAFTFGEHGFGDPAYTHGRETAGEPRLMRVQIDAVKCEGFGPCADAAPALFTLDEWGYATVAGEGLVPAGQEEDARRAVDVCPVQAISIQED